MSAASGPLRIAVACEYSSINGGERSLLAVVDELRNEAVEFLPLLPATDGALAAEFRRRGHALRIVPWQAGPDGLARDLNRLLSTAAPHLLHANSLTLARRIGGIAPQLPIPVSGHVRDIMALSDTAVRALNGLRGIVAVSAAASQELVRQGVRTDLVRTIHNGIALDQFHPRTPTGWLHRELGIPAAVPLVAVIGQICLRKGQDDFTAAAVLLSDEQPAPHFLLIGLRHSTKPESVAFDESITTTFTQQKMEQRLHRLGFRDDLAAILPELALLLHPARQEPFGRVLLEAAACGVPIVATDVGGTGELLKHGISAWLSPPHQPVALAEGMRALLQDRDRALQLGAGARAAAERFSIVKSARQTLHYWRELAISPVT